VAPPSETHEESEDEEMFDLNKLKNDKAFAGLKEIKVTFDYNGKLIPVKEPNLTNLKVYPVVKIGKKKPAGGPSSS